MKNFPDRLGCYRVGELKFYSKLEAIAAMNKTGIHLHWDFNEPVFSSYDWTTEPREDLLELYRRRAQQIREDYDYVILMCSGGADSETVLQSFVDNDVKVDELVSYSNYAGTNDKDDHMNSEVWRRTIPRYEKLKETCPWIKFRLVDISKMAIDFFNDPAMGTDWIYNMNMMWTPNSASRTDMVAKIKDWMDLINQGKRLCLVWGHDKPRIVQHDDGRYSFRFIDIIDNGATVKSISGKQPYSDELFFWTPSLPEILIKQAHIIKRYLDHATEQTPFISSEKSDLAFRWADESRTKKLWLGVHGVHRLIYPNWDITTFDAGKFGSIVFSPRDKWFFNLDDNNLSKRNWQQGIDRVFKMVPDYWKNDPNDISKGLKACWSRDYFLS